MHVYLKQIHKIHETHPEVSWHFNQGPHVVHISDWFLTGLSPDLVIEQVLMRSMKISGRLTRGRGMTETQRLVWLMVHPVCAEVNNAAQRLDHGKAREIYGRLVWTIIISWISKPIQWQFAKHCDMNQCWHQCKRGHRKRCRREDLDVNGAAQKCCNTASRQKTKLSHSVHQLSKSTIIDRTTTVVWKAHHSRNPEWPVGRDLPIRTLHLSPSNLQSQICCEAC